MSMSNINKDPRLDLNASCNENGPNLFSNPTPYFLVPIIVICIKLVTIKA